MLSIVIVGFGGMGKYHYRQLKKNKLLNVIGVYDINLEACNIAKNYGLKIYKSYNEVLNDSTVNAVLIALPNDIHYEYVLLAANAKKHILCEKPVTLSLTLLEEMINVAKKAGVVFMVNQNRREDKDFLAAKKIIESNILGKVYKIESNVMGSHGIPGDWRKEQAKGGGMILDWGVHLIDQAICMFPNEIEYIYCKNSYVYGLNVDDGCDIRLTFEGNIDYKIYIDTNAFQRLPRWIIYGENGTAKIKNWNRSGSIIAVKTRLDKGNKGSKLGNGFSKTMADRSWFSIRRTKIPKVKNNPNFIYSSFKNSIENKETPIIKPNEIIRVMKIMEAAMKSDKENIVIHTKI